MAAIPWLLQEVGRLFCLKLSFGVERIVHLAVGELLGQVGLVFAVADQEEVGHSGRSNLPRRMHGHHHMQELFLPHPHRPDRPGPRRLGRLQHHLRLVDLAQHVDQVLGVERDVQLLRPPPWRRSR